MAKRKTEPKEPKADIVALGKSLANSLATANERLVYWFDLLCPDWKPEKTGAQIIEGSLVPTWTTKLDGARRYLIARLGYSSDAVDVMAPAKLIELLKREVESKTREPDAKKIPPEHRTKPMSYRKAAELLGKGSGKDAAEWMSKCVQDGTIACERITRQTHVFDTRDFPETVWPRIKVAGSGPKSP